MRGTEVYAIMLPMSFPAYLKYVGLTVLFAVATVNFTKTTLNVIQSSKRLDTTKDEVAQLEGQKNALEEELEYKKSDEYVEEEARNKLGLVKPGEELFVVSQVLGTTTHNDQVSTPVDENLDNLHLWLKLFF